MILDRWLLVIYATKMQQFDNIRLFSLLKIKYANDWNVQK